MKKTLSFVALACAALTAYAQDESAGAAAAATAQAIESSVPGYVPYGNLERASAAEVDRSRMLGESVAKDLLEAYNNRRTPEMEKFANNQRRRADDIADSAMAAERDKMLEFLGLDPKADTALYFFVSWSMPLEMLRSYAIEAMWSGGILLFKGVPPDKELGTFILKDLQSLVYGKGAAANISLDPRLFDAYDIKAVPSIVFTTVRTDMSCQGVNPVSFRANNMDLSYDTCPALDPSVYSKISGAVTTSYALQSFIDEGMPQAKPYLNALARGWSQGQTPGKQQKPFEGQWESVLTPSERKAALEMLGTATSAPTPSAPAAPSQQ